MISIKKTQFTLLFLIASLGFFYVNAQENRTTKTIVADVLAQLPANKTDAYHQQFELLTNTGEQGILMLVDMLGATGKKNNETVEYAISGWTNFVANDSIKRDIAANSYAKALQLPLDNTIKQFLIRQIELIGNENNVAILSTFLTDNELIFPSAQALANLKNKKAKEALINGLKNAKNDTQRIILVNAIEQTNCKHSEPALIEVFNKTTSHKLQNSIYGALGKIGSINSLSILKNGMIASDYSTHKSSATVSYLSLLKKLNKSNPELVKNEAEQILAFATKNKKQNLRIEATNLLMKNSTVDKNKLLATILTDKEVKYVASGLSTYSNFADKKGKDLVIKVAKKSKSELLKSSMLNWLGEMRVENSTPLLLKTLKDDNLQVQKVAIKALANTNPEQALLPLIDLLKSENPTTVANAYQNIASLNTNLYDAIKANYTTFSNEGKLAALDLIGERKIGALYNLVLNEMNNANGEKVKEKAAKTLKLVATSSNLSELFTMLENDNIEHKSDIQAAVNNILAIETTEKQLETIKKQMEKSEKPFVYFSSLANTNSKEALQILTEAYKTNPKYAFEALTEMNIFEAIYPLLDIVRNNDNKNEITKGVDALIRLISKSTQTGAVKANYLQEIFPFTTDLKQKRSILSNLGNTDAFQSLLFVEKHLDDKNLNQVACQSGMRIALNNPQFSGEITTRILEKISKTMNHADAEYHRQSIQKFLSENPTSGGLLPLFNGEDLKGWKGLVKNPIARSKMTKDELEKEQIKADEAAQKSWIVKDGVLLFTGKGDNLCTVKQYGDFEMIVDWKLLPGPEPDAGIYLRGSPQVQIWDTARVNVGAQVGSGGLYNNKIHTSIPTKLADQKVGEWNSFHIKMIGDRVTVFLNGELVTDNVILENYWDRNQPIFSTEQIELQAHGSKVEYRNIYLKEIERPEPFALSNQEIKEGFKILFDGTNMHEWAGNITDHVIEDGNIVYYPSKQKSQTKNLFTKEEYGDFIFRFEFQLTPGANNGLGIRTPQEGDPAYVGMELQILDDDAPIYNNLEDYQHHGSVYGIIPAKRGALKPVGEWNYQEVIAKGDNIKITLNGTVIVDGNIKNATKNGNIDKKEHPGLFNKKGHIGFLGHGSVVKFRNIRIKSLDKMK